MSRPGSSAEILSAGPRPPYARVAIDRRGVEWRVREVDARATPGARAPRCLVCETHEVVRRLWRYPADWHRRADRDLLALCGAE